MHSKVGETLSWKNTGSQTCDAADNNLEKSTEQASDVDRCGVPGPPGERQDLSGLPDRRAFLWQFLYLLFLERLLCRRHDTENVIDVL